MKQSTGIRSIAESRIVERGEKEEKRKKERERKKESTSSFAAAKQKAQTFSPPSPSFYPDPAPESRQVEGLVDRRQIVERGHAVVEVARLNFRGPASSTPHDAAQPPWTPKLRSCLGASLGTAAPEKPWGEGGRVKEREEG